MALRRSFNRSGLVRWLDDPRWVDVQANDQDVAERLSQWLGAFDAVRLFGAHDALEAAAATPAAGRSPVKPPAMRAAFTRLLEELDAAIDRPWTYRGGADTAAGSFTPYRQRHLELQRLMETRIAGWRAQLRQALSAAASPALRQLAVLDAAWEQALAPREARLLATVPARLERRFKAAQEAAGPETDASVWLPGFEREAREIVRAERDVRLEPAMGLMDAYGIECEKVQ